jgi:uncharacterized membrane protein YbaN (DUF454 family)
VVLGAYSLGLVTLNVILAHMCGVQFFIFPHMCFLRRRHFWTGYLECHIRLSFFFCSGIFARMRGLYSELDYA